MSLGQQLLVDLLAPPIFAGLWWLFSRGWALAIRAGEVSDETKSRQKAGLVVMLGLLYVLMFGITIFLHFTEGR